MYEYAESIRLLGVTEDYRLCMGCGELVEHADVDMIEIISSGYVRNMFCLDAVQDTKYYNRHSYGCSCADRTY